VTAAAVRDDIHPCPVCGLDEMEGFAHRHHRPAASAWDPMPPYPGRLYCGPLDVNAYWTGADWRPSCCLVHVIAAEYRAELPEQLHPFHAATATGLVPIPRQAGDLEGPMLEVPDRGPLGGWPWASRAHRRFGAVTMRFGEQTLDHGDYRVFPWSYAIERRLEGYCRHRHVTRPDLWPEHEGDAICAHLVRLIAAAGVPPEDLVPELVPARRIRPLLDDVLPWLWSRVSETVNQLERRH
jgi:hypothetical protein